MLVQFLEHQILKDSVSDDLAILSYRQAMRHVETLQRACREVKLL